MPYYQDTHNQLHYLSDEDIANGGLSLLPMAYTEITDAEAEAILAAHQAAAHQAAALSPNAAGFTQAVKSALGGIVGANALASSYPLFFAAVQTLDWPDVQALVIDAQTKAVITALEYAAIKAAALQFNIPVNLP